MSKLSILDVVVLVTEVTVVAVTIPVSVAVGIEHVEGSAVVTCPYCWCSRKVHRLLAQC